MMTPVFCAGRSQRRQEQLISTTTVSKATQLFPHKALIPKAYRILFETFVFYCSLLVDWSRCWWMDLFLFHRNAGARIPGRRSPPPHDADTYAEIVSYAYLCAEWGRCKIALLVLLKVNKIRRLLRGRLPILFAGSWRRSRKRTERLLGSMLYVSALHWKWNNNLKKFV